MSHGLTCMVFAVCCALHGPGAHLRNNACDGSYIFDSCRFLQIMSTIFSFSTLFSAHSGAYKDIVTFARDASIALTVMAHAAAPCADSFHTVYRCGAHVSCAVSDRPLST
jgi:hypothetical protein